MAGWLWFLPSYPALVCWCVCGRAGYVSGPSQTVDSTTECETWFLPCRRWLGERCLASMERLWQYRASGKSLALHTITKSEQEPRGPRHCRRRLWERCGSVSWRMSGVRVSKARGARTGRGGKNSIMRIRGEQCLLLVKCLLCSRHGACIPRLVSWTLQNSLMRRVILSSSYKEGS